MGEKITEELPQIGVVQLVIELQGTGMGQEDIKLIAETVAEKIGMGCHLLHNAIIFLLLSGCFEPLPWKGTTKEVHKGVGEQLQTIMLSLLHTQICKTKVNNIALVLLHERLMELTNAPSWIRERQA
jgi:hypothetical protein